MTLEDEQTEGLPADSSSRWPRRFAAAGIILGIAFSYRLWTGYGKSFPAAAIIPCFLSPTIDLVLSGMVLACCLAILLEIAQKKATIALFVCSILLVLLDLNKFQPWLYEYLIIILLCFLGEKKAFQEDENIDTTLQPISLLLIAIYFFSGLQKLNWRFFTLIGPWLTGFTHNLNDPVFNNPAAFWTAVAIALTEVILAVLLCFRQTRLFGMIAGVLLHLSVISVIGPHKLNTNSAVWPWNIVQILLLIYCFWNVGEGNLFHLKLKQRPAAGFVILCTGLIVPLAGLLQLADAYPSFALYAGDVPAGKLMFDPSTAETLPLNVRRDCCFFDENTGLDYCDLNDWLHLETGASAYPSDFAFRLEGRKFAQDHQGKLVVLKLYHYPKLTSTAKERYETMGRASSNPRP